MSKNLLLRGLILQLLMAVGIFSASAQTVFINEIHYDNDGADLGEAIEVAGPAGTDLNGWSLVLYNGNGGAPYSTQTLSGTLTDMHNGFGFIEVAYAANGIQNGAPDGIALVNATGELVQFLSYEGSFVGVGGPANGITSTDIGVFQTGTTTNATLQLTGTGTQYQNFSWADKNTRTFGAVNTDQSFGTSTGGGDDPDQPEEPEQPVETGSTLIFINEIHYDNAGADTGEGVEVAGPAGTDLTGWQLIAYNGNNGLSYSTLTLSGVIDNKQAGYGAIFFPILGLQNGAPDGISLVNAAGELVQFLSYEGAFTAADGPASGILSTDIGVSEASDSPATVSLQLTGTGKVYEDFSWTAGVTTTHNRVNEGQTFVGAPVVFINEIHYDNTGTDTGEAVELAASAGTDLNGWSLVLYNGNNSAAYGTITLSGVVTDVTGTGWGFETIFVASGIQNGSPDGIALVNASGEVVQFLSYEGTLTAADGPAQGLTSTDIVVAESSDTPAGYSLQLIGSGNKYQDFTWSGPIPQTYTATNTGQSLGGSTTTPDPEPELPKEVTIAAARQLPIGTVVIVTGTLTVTDQLGGPAFIQDQTGGIALFDARVQGEGNFAIGDQIQVTAVIGAFNQQIQLVDVSEIKELGATTPVAPVATTIAGLSALEGQLVTISNVTFTDTRGLLFPDSNFSITDGTGTTNIRIDADVESLLGRYKPQEAITITGVVGSFRGSLQIFPRFIADLPGTMPYVPQGSDIPVSTTLDIMSWNIAFFGSTLKDFGPSDVQLQLQNATKVIQEAKADIIAVQEISDDNLLQQLADGLGYEKVCSDRFSYSFNGPDPTFPEQRVCFIYNPAVIEVVSTRVMFEEMYDAARNGQSTPLDSYPSSPSSFWSSGRLPYMIVVDATINGITERLHLINIHAKSGADNSDLTRRRYDIQVLKDSLDTYYPSANIVLLGDYNDDVDESIGGGASTYSAFIDAPDFNVITSTLSEAGLRSFISRDNVIDHMAISNELYDNYLVGSETLVIPFTYIWNYAGTTSDHLPILARFDLFEPLAVEIAGDNIVYAGYAPEACTSITATVTGGSGAYTYSWSTGATEATINVCPETTTAYTLTVEDARGNSTTTTYSVCAIDATCDNSKIQLCWKPNAAKENVVKLCLPEHLAAFFINRGASLGDCFAEEACNTTTTKAATTSLAAREANTPFISIDSELVVTPTLAQTRAKVQFVVLEEGLTTLMVYSLSGQKMATLYQGTDNFGTVRTADVDVRNFSAGMYVVKMTTASGAVFTSKMVVGK